MLVASAALFLSYAAYRKSRLLIGCLLGVVIAATMLGEALLRSPERFVAKYGVLNSETIVRKGMGDDFAPAFDRPLLDGAEFEVIQRTSLWTLGRFPESVTVGSKTRTLPECNTHFPYFAKHVQVGIKLMFGCMQC